MTLRRREGVDHPDGRALVSSVALGVDANACDEQLDDLPLARRVVGALDLVHLIPQAGERSRRVCEVHLLRLDKRLLRS